MTRKFGKKAFLLMFLTIYVLWVVWFVYIQFAEVKNNENRDLNEKPRLTTDNYLSYSQMWENYFNDHLPFRNTFVTINTMIDLVVFDKSSNDQVIIGKKGWMFYKYDNNSDSIADYKGTNVYSEENLKDIAQKCTDLDSELKARGKEFVIFIAPNKERIYYDMMPDNYGAPQEEYRAGQLVKYLKENTCVRVVYPYNELMEAKEKLSEEIYYKTDTHWNYIGGYIGASCLLDELGIKMDNIDDKNIMITRIGTKEGDLAKMLNIATITQKYDDEYSVSGYENHHMIQLENDFNTVYNYIAERADKRRIYIYRDSFSDSMAPYIGSQFSESWFRYFGTYTYEDFMKQDADIFVYETVERNLGLLQGFSLGE